MAAARLPFSQMTLSGEPTLATRRATRSSQKNIFLPMPDLDVGDAKDSADGAVFK